MSQQVTATLGCKKKDYNSVINRGDEVKSKLTSNVRYASPNPDLATLSTALEAARKGRKDWDEGRGSSADLANYKQAIKVLFGFIVQLCAFVNNATPFDEVALATTGFPLSNAKHKLPLMEPPRNVRRHLLAALGLEHAKINCKKPANASKYQKILYKFYRSTTTDFASAGLIAICTKTTYTDKPPVTVATSFYYWVTAVTPAGESDPSDLCHVVVVPLTV